MAKADSILRTPRNSEVNFWACFAVVFALVSQVLFPPQVMAMPSSHGVKMVLCSAGMDSQPIVETTTLILKSAPKKPGLAGLKCAQCVLASVTGITTPEPVFQPAIYTVCHADFTPATRRSPIKARAPPRPHSCGPPSQI
ncbi:hypothetical protein [Asticcacaulis benevestitus]|uniref:DUF2946 domain-containing protein n=1 Tax=Asticcacaulis benevestitus DSM 16100 = ATCC BAA-896 TaxID=1121022 RepID=V4PJT7_9CAUL|nr:hypothetical protein [Asticcacaulis benevestitus]ESQ94222.1 hypothetical protein ABENE_01560 [Asticcacaulis benevestitus DSM 16100 = ATCC BAA-896]